MKILLVFFAGIVVAGLVLLLAAFAGLFPTTATATPPHWEESLAMRALDASLEKRANGLKNPYFTKDAVALAAGRALYDDNCAGCHGGAKASSAWGSKGFYPRVPQFFQEGTDVGPEEAYAAIHDGIRYSGMGAWRDLMKEDDMWKVANFVASIKPPKGAPMSKMH